MLKNVSGSESYPTYAGIHSKKYTYIGMFHHLLLALRLVSSLLVVAAVLMSDMPG